MLGLLPGCQPAPYVPGLGEIMTLTQMRHAKLWLAGTAGNWPLAEYELEELHEGLDDAVTLHPTHKEAQVAVLVPEFMTAPLEQVEDAVAARDGAAFTAAFDALTAGCNGCHQATGFGFNAVARPAGNAYTNQVFEPAAR